MHRTGISWVPLVGIGLAVVAAVSVASALAAPSAARPFELVAIDRYVGECPDCFPVTHDATFMSAAPFCESGTIDDIGSRRRGETDRRYSCRDGSGSLTLAERAGGASAFGGEWTIVEGSGRYAGLRGTGSYLSEQLSQNPAWVYRTTVRGFADYDSVPPSVAFASASATKLRRVPGAYAIRVALSLRDDGEANIVAYTLRVQEGPEHPRDRQRPLLDTREGRTASGAVSMTLRVFPSSKRVRSVRLWLTGVDPVGNEVSIDRSLKLPR